MGALRELMEKKTGWYDKHGRELTYKESINYTGKAYRSQDEALDRRYSYSAEPSKDESGVFGGKRKNLFGN